jgi:hypothetical protein
MQPQPPYPPQHHFTMPPAAPAKRKVWPWILAAVVCAAIGLCVGGLALVASAGNAVNEQIEHGSTELNSHVTITSCERDSLGFTEVSFTVTNSADSVKSYWIQFGVLDAQGTRLTEAHGIVNNLAPGATAKETALGAAEVGKGAKCVLERVN